MNLTKTKLMDGESYETTRVMYVGQITRFPQNGFFRHFTGPYYEEFWYDSNFKKGMVLSFKYSFINL